MPNWCDNRLKISSSDPAKIQRLKDAWDSGHFMQSLHPCPQELYDTIAGGYSDDEKQKELEIKEKLTEEMQNINSLQNDESLMGLDSLFNEQL